MSKTIIRNSNREYTSNFLKNTALNRARLVIFAVIFAAVGVYVIYFGSAAGNPTPPPPASGNQWQMTFDEEFNGTDYDHSKLTPCFDWNYGACTVSFNNGYEAYQPGQVQVSGGMGRLIAAPLSPPIANSGCYQGSCTYKSGLLSTARPNAGTGSDYLYKFTYGYVEANLKVPNTQGFFTAWWMLPADSSYNYAYEIDILEELANDPTTMFMTYHYNNRSQSYPVNNGQYNNGACPVQDYSQAFHRFGVDWEPSYVAFYIDGIKCGQFNGTGSQISNVPMQLILDQMVSNDWERSWNVPLLNTTLTSELDVDYIRVYQQVPSGGGSAPGDINGDGHVTITDLSLLLSSYGNSGSACVTAPQYICDLNGTGGVTIVDLSILLSHFGT